MLVHDREVLLQKTRLLAGLFGSLAPDAARFVVARLLLRGHGLAVHRQLVGLDDPAHLAVDGRKFLRPPAEEHPLELAKLLV